MHNNLDYPYDLIGFKNKNSQKSEFEVIEFIGFRKSGSRNFAYYKVKFDTGFEREARRDAILNGGVKNPDIRTNIASRIDETEFIGFKRDNTAGEPFEVIEYDSRRKSKLYYKVRFINSGNEKVFDKYSILEGRIKDPIHIEGFIGYKGINNQGENFEVISFANRGNGQTTYNVKFEDTGYVKEFLKGPILKGNIKDPYYPSIYGVACCGEVSTWDGNNTSREYYIWHHMISRVYNESDCNYCRYGGMGITVCERWHCYENFLKDLPNIPGYSEWKSNPSGYELDKDVLQQDINHNNKIYSPETCIFIPSLVNNLEQAIRNSNNTTNFYGVFTQQSGNYSVKIGKEYYGTYSDPIVAANVYNQVAKLKGYPAEYLNNVEYIPIVECTKQRINTVRMCHIVDNSKSRS